ncbi:protein maelstrom homolog [Lepeophtheirus salmonis]|uniref:protein maelstrom homolog n=1 Tax=Lepeophtheirus salmonis TaxID=72036 RepID=UPI001AE441B1|nr:protein maelstrom homolog [Lepeophtheirus salmonis]
MTKAKKKAPFVCFCLEQARLQPRLKGKSIPELVDLCSDDWNGLSKSERDRFAQNKQIGETTSPVESKKGERYDSFGRPLSFLMQKERETKETAKLRRRDILERAGVAHNKKSNFHFMDVTLWVCTNEGKSLPAEIAIIVMNMIEGITQRFVQKIHPGTPPLGYQGDMKKNSDIGHGIWLDHQDELNSDYLAIVNKITDILTPGKDDSPAVQSKLLPIFVAPSDLESIRAAMQWLILAAGQDPSMINIVPYEAHILLWDLLSVAPFKTPESDIPTMNLAKAHLEGVTFLNVDEAACDFHKSKDSTNCALLKATRLAFKICEFCCFAYDLDAVEGSHYPSSSTRFSNHFNASKSDYLNFSNGSAAHSTLNCSFSSTNLKKPHLDPSISFESLKELVSHPLKEYLELHKFRDLQEIMLKNGNYISSTYENITSLSNGEYECEPTSFSGDLSDISSMCTYNTEYSNFTD